MTLLDTLWYASAAAAAFALARLAAARLVRVYPFFSLYLAAVVLRDGGLLAVGDPRSHMYMAVWLCTAPAAALLQAAAVAELFSKICANYPGIDRFVRVLLSATVVTAVGFASLTIAFDADVRPWSARTFQLVMISQRWITTALAAFLLATALFFHRYGGAMRRNLVRHRVLLTVYLSALTAGTLAFNLIASDSGYAANVAILFASTVCMVLWGVLLTPAGERDPVRPQISAQDVARVEEWNRELIEAGRWLTRAR